MGRFIGAERSRSRDPGGAPCNGNSEVVCLPERDGEFPPVFCARPEPLRFMYWKSPRDAPRAFFVPLRIAPGFFIGDQNRRVLINPDGSLTDRSKKVLAKTPMNRFGDIKELNGAVQFLCSEAASFVTGAMLPIDGGFSAFSGV